MPDLELPIFRRFPALAGQLPHRRFLAGVTPVQPLVLDGVPEGRLFIKRDDLSCSLYAGNKPRKLEFILGRALERGVRRIVTTGGLGTNHGLATTILAREVGIDTTLVLVNQPVTAKVHDSLLLFASYGGRVIHARSVPGAVVSTALALSDTFARGERPALVPTGGSCPLGNIGIVSAGLELGEQIRAGELPEPEQIFVPVGTGGTIVGLTLGIRLAGLSSCVVGVLVTDILPPGPSRLARAAARTMRLMRRFDPSVPDLAIGAADFALVTDQLGAGYGALTPESEEAVVVASQSNIGLETTYTGKCLAEILARARRGELAAGPTLFWNTYNGADVWARAPRRAKTEELPASLRRLLAQSTDR
ncbi:1-aminocyclopropane-1-carboxylate deaminase/D-cysteine desulfhydrase [Myxococcota bacterium]